MEFRKVVLILPTFIAMAIGQRAYETANINEHMINDNNHTVESITIAIDSISFNKSIANSKNSQISLNEQRSLPDMAYNIFSCNEELSHDHPIFITSPGFPFFYMFGQNIGCHLRGSTGRGIEVIVYEVSLDSVQNDYLLIKPGDQTAPADRAVVFTSQLEGVYKYWFHDSNDLFVHFVSPARMAINSQFRGFNMSVQYIDEYIPTPDEVDNETAIAITPRDRYTVFLTHGYLENWTPMDFVNVSQEFIQILADMATNFTQLMDLETGEFPMNETVQLTMITRCMLGWPDGDRCVAVTFSIPTFHNETDDHYELSAKQLEAMWLMFGQSHVVIGALSELGLEEYFLPDDIRILTWWLVASGGVILAMILVSVIIANYDYFGNYKSVERFTDTDSVTSRKNSSLYPAPHQDMPAMFPEGSQDMWGSDLAYADDCDYNGASYANNGFVKDGELCNLDSDEEIVMSLPDGPPTKPRLNREMDA